MSSQVNANPSKSFFVDMLTRDIELLDAVLDLVDNCIDGVQRQLQTTPPKHTDKPYAGFEAKLTFSSKAFSIEDNCGGIPRIAAEKTAFRLGRPEDYVPENLPTVGVYGIGMKRAIFKMGRRASVTTRHSGKSYKVEISPEWMRNDASWMLPISDVNLASTPKGIVGGGTRIDVDHLLTHIAGDFDRQKSKFLSDLAATISTHYSYVLHKGFNILIDGVKIKPKALALLASATNHIEPFVYQVQTGPVQVDLIVGLYRDIPDDQEITDELEGRTSAHRETCGWTVICNDRVVLYADRSRLTGWGEASVPSYHPQFNAIAGIVRFMSDDVALLPVTTTKRGLEAGSELFLAVKDVMREGLKHFTNFTNHWKSHGAERNALLRAAAPVDPFKAAAAVKANDWAEVRKGMGGRKYVPSLPKPVVSTGQQGVTIKFIRPTKQVEAVGELMFDDKATPPNQIGEALFDQAYKRAIR